MSDQPHSQTEEHVELDPDHEDAIVRYCNRAIRYGVRAMSMFMVLIIFLAILDAWYLLYEKLIETPVLIIEVSDILAIFSAALIVLIAIEIYTNITLYLTADVIHLKLVVATALMAVARKVITLDDKTLEPGYFYGYAALGLAFGVTYWLISSKGKS
ncbi:MAG: phosphate-starvation-inducible PsiE family protein [Paracoccaceae bacterium]